MGVVERRKKSSRRVGVDRRKNLGRRREDRGEPPAKAATRAPGQLRMFNTGVTRIERRHGDRRAGADRRRSTDRRAAVPAKAVAPVKVAGRTRLVPCAPGSGWLNSTQAAEHLGVPRKGLYRLHLEGAIKGHRRSGRRRGFLVFEKAALDALIKAKRSS